MLKLDGKQMVSTPIWSLLIFIVTILTVFTIFITGSQESQNTISPPITNTATTPSSTLDTTPEPNLLAEEEQEEIVEEALFSQTNRELLSEEIALEITNATRANLGLSELTRNQDFDLYAKLWAQEMASINQPFSPDFFHSPHFIDSEIEFIELPMYESNWELVNENVGKVSRVPESEEPLSFITALYGEGENPDDGFLASVSHKCSLINPNAIETGIGVHIEGDSIFMAQLFVQYEEGVSVISEECLVWQEQIQG